MQPVREEYRRLAADLRWHAATFDVDLSGRALDDAAMMLTALECADRLVDELPTRAERDGFAAAVLRRLSTGEGHVAAELRASVDPLRAVLVERGTLEAFVGLTARAFAVAEEVREAAEVRAYLEAVHEEGRLTPQMTLCVLPGDLPAPFVAFFRGLGDVGNFVDELVDVRWDYRQGDRALRPGVWVHLQLVWRLVVGAVGVARAHPRPGALVVWGLGYLWRPMWGPPPLPVPLPVPVPVPVPVPLPDTEVGGVRAAEDLTAGGSMTTWPTMRR